MLYLTMCGKFNILQNSQISCIDTSVCVCGLLWAETTQNTIFQCSASQEIPVINLLRVPTMSPSIIKYHSALNDWKYNSWKSGFRGPVRLHSHWWLGLERIVAAGIRFLYCDSQLLGGATSPLHYDWSLTGTAIHFRPHSLRVPVVIDDCREVRIAAATPSQWELQKVSEDSYRAYTSPNRWYECSIKNNS